MNKKQFYLVVFCLIWTGELLYSQSTIQMALTPEINLSKTIAPQWKWIVNLESRQAIYEDTWNYTYLLTDMSSSLAYKTLSGTTITGGVQLRYRGDDFYYRTAQQISLVKSYDVYRLGHRFASDQTFGPEDPEFRFRYRISMDRPLSGSRVDIGEWYLKLGNEYLLSIHTEDDIEVRLMTFLGYQLPNNKIEIGLEYRMDKWLVEGFRQRYFWGITWYGNI